MRRLSPFFFLLCLACVTTKEDIIAPEGSQSNELSFPEAFDFRTSRIVTLRLTSEASSSRYRVYYLEDGEAFNLATLGNSGKDVASSLTVPTYLSHLMVEETTDTGIQTQEIMLDGRVEQTVSFAVPQGRTSNDCVDRLYAVENSQGGFWSIDITNDDYIETPLPNLQGGGSIACALDQDNALLYYNIGNTLYSYDIDAGTFSVAFNGNPFNGNYPRLAFLDGYLYMSNGTTMYKVDASTNQVEASYSIQGIQNTASGGDLAFTSDGTLYLSCFSGLYRFDSFDGNVATVSRISAENFPFQLTSMAIDRQDRIFVGTNDANSNLLEMNNNDGSYRIVKTFDHKINDLTAWKCDEADLSQSDRDNDGIIDAVDDYPDDATAAFDVFTPSEIGYGTLAFEDHWPFKGDYDFNDMVINYRFTAVLNSSNRAIRMRIGLVIAAAGASYQNGFGIALPMDASQIASVTGSSLTGNIISLDGKGLEQGQSQAVIIAFDNALAELGGGSIINTDEGRSYVTPRQLDIVVEFTEPIEAAIVANPPFNPFIFINGDRGRELHLRDQLPTDLANDSLFGTSEDRTQIAQGVTYVSEDNVPWAIDIIHNFRYPLEKTRIDRGYNHFVPWGQSNDAIYRDWYKDNTGYRNDNRLFFAPN